MSEITYHLATPDDVRTLVEQRIQFAIELSGGTPPETIQALKDQMLDYFARATLNKACISFIARVDGQTAGVGSVHFREMPGNIKNPTGKWGYIMNMYTVPEHRRKGICKGILEALIAEGERMGYTVFELHATKEGEMVYRQEGFELHHEPTYRKYLKK